jgi:hypothetical protein
LLPALAVTSVLSFIGYTNLADWNEMHSEIANFNCCFKKEPSEFQHDCL